MIKIALSGCAGGISGSHLRAYSQLSGVRLVAMCDVDKDKGQQIAQKYQATFYDDYEKMLDREPEIDMVDICSPDQFHCRQIVSAAEHKKHILCEKPIAITIEELQKIESAVVNNNIYFMPAMVYRWQPEIRKIKDVIESAKIGKPVAVFFTSRGSFYPYPETSFYRKRESGGQFVHNGVHFLDILTFLLNSIPTKVFTTSLSYYKDENRLETPNYYLGSFLFSRNEIVKLEYNLLLSYLPMGSWEMVIVGNEGAIELDDLKDSSISYFSKDNFFCVNSFSYFSEAAFLSEIEHFVDCIRNNKAPSISLKEAIAVTRGCILAVESAYTKKEYEI